MAYVPTNWKNNDIITAEKLNKMEGGISGAQNGYTVETNAVTLIPEQSVTTQSGGGFSIGLVTGDTVAPGEGTNATVTFDGTQYTIEVTSAFGMIAIGEIDNDQPSFETYPFLVLFNTGTDEVTLITPEAGSYSITATGTATTVTVTQDFTSAVEKISNIHAVTAEYVGSGYEVSESLSTITGWLNKGHGVIVFCNGFPCLASMDGAEVTWTISYFDDANSGMAFQKYYLEGDNYVTYDAVKILPWE